MSATLAYSVARSVPPAYEPLTLAEAKTHLRVVGSNDNGYIESLIVAAREELEAQTRLALITQTWIMKLNEWPASEVIHLTPAPLISVTGISYLDTAGASQTLATSVYEVDTARMPGCIWLKYSQDWPTLRSIQNAVTITYKCGYGADATDVPMRAKQAMLMWIESAFCQRAMDGTSQQSYQHILRGLSYGEYP